MLSRRDWLTTTVRLGAAAAAAPTLAPLALGAQAPARSGALVRRSQQPPDYETPVDRLDSFITPNDAFFVRSHMPVPTSIDAATWTFSIGGSVNTPLSLTLAELRRMPSTTVTVTLECAGNGRAFFEPAVAGIQWRKGAVGTARWTGVRLADLLARAGLKPSAKVLATTSADKPMGTQPAFVRQVPLDKALHPDTLIAWEMNGVAIPVDHGFPLRLVVPGWEGAYSVKWLTGLTALDQDSDSFWVAGTYRYPTRAVAPGEAVDAKDMAPLTGLVVKSLITSPTDGAAVRPGPVTVAGFAWAGEADIAKVDISLDNGASWHEARLVGEQARFAWRRFEYRTTLTGAGPHTILSRATDSRGNVQPQVARWNPNGYLWNQVDAITVGTTPAAQTTSAAPGPITPDAGGAGTYSRACTSCHGTDLVDQQRLSKTGWTREVEKMMRWGAPVPEAEKDGLVEFLLQRLSTR